MITRRVWSTQWEYSPTRASHSEAEGIIAIMLKLSKPAQRLLHELTLNRFTFKEEKVKYDKDSLFTFLDRPESKSACQTQSKILKELKDIGLIKLAYRKGKKFPMTIYLFNPMKLVPPMRMRESYVVAWNSFSGGFFIKWKNTGKVTRLEKKAIKELVRG